MTGNEFINLFNPGFRGVALNTVTGALRPLAGGGLIVFFSFVFAIFLLVNEDYKLPKMYLYLVIAVSFLSVFVSATRLWFVIFSFIFACYVLVSRKKFLSIIGIGAVGFVVLSTLMYTGLIQSDLLLQSSWGRLRQVFDVASGGVYSVDTAANRFVNQFPIIMGVIKQSPLIGYGFSNVSLIYYDNDFGFLNTILIFGVIGFFLFIYFFIKYFTMIILSVKKIGDSNSIKVPLKIMAILLAGILIGYFSTWDFFTYNFHKVFFISLVIALAEFFVMQADKEELQVKQSVNS